MEQAQFNKTARLTGIWYLLLAISGVLGFMVFHPKIFIPANAQQTVTNIVNHHTIASVRLVLELVIIVSQALAAAWFYKLFCTINKWAAATLCIWGTVNSVIITVSAIAMNVAIDIANSASITMQEKTIALQILQSIISNAWAIGGLFFGLWLLPMGYIIISSKRLPIWLGRTLILGGIGYLLQTFINCTGVKSTFINLLVLPATIGEFWIIFYLLVYGIRPKTDTGLP
jgi:Domain of unknown function (DUF4386)